MSNGGGILLLWYRQRVWYTLILSAREDGYLTDTCLGPGGGIADVIFLGEMSKRRAIDA
jgi:hypothetical protein